MSLGMSVSYAAENTIINDVINPLFNALKNGDVKSVEAYIGDPLYSEVKVQLQNNQEYPEFLRQYYLESYVEIIKIVDHTNEQKNVYVDLHFSSNDKQTLELQLHKTASGDWKVTQQSIVGE
jgi:hypothetical protein